MRSKMPTWSDVTNSPIGEVASIVCERSRAWSLLGKHIEDCFISHGAPPKANLDPFKVLLLLPNLQSLFQINNVSRDKELFDLADWANKECRRELSEFESALRNFCSAQKFQFEGGFPRFVLGGFLEIRVDDKQPVCRIADKNFKTLFLPTLASTIIETIKLDAARKFDQVRFLEDLYKAYQRAAINVGIPLGEPILAKQVLPELAFVKQSPVFLKSPLKSTFVDYSLKEFARDLARILKEDRFCVTDGKRLLTTPIANSSDGIPVMIHGAYRYIGRIAFIEET